jgi:hypothetical protein
LARHPARLDRRHEIRRVAYHSSSGAYRILGRPDTTGDWVPTGRSTARAGTILGYDGQAISRTDYAGLFAAYSTTYGAATERPRSTCRIFAAESSPAKTTWAAALPLG